jgi:hypothetical protein
MGESEAKRLGLEMQSEGFDLIGIHLRIGIAHELRAGKSRVRNPTFVFFSRRFRSEQRGVNLVGDAGGVTIDFRAMRETPAWVNTAVRSRSTHPSSD